MEELDLKTAQLIGQVTISGLGARHYADQGPQEWFGFDFFWGLLQDDTSAGLSDEMHSVLLGQLGVLFAWEGAELVRILFMEKCIENLRKFRSVPQTLIVARNIIRTSFAHPILPLIRDLDLFHRDYAWAEWRALC